MFGCWRFTPIYPRVLGSKAQGSKKEEVRPSQGGTDPGAEIGKGEITGRLHSVPAEAQELAWVHLLAGNQEPNRPASSCCPFKMP